MKKSDIMATVTRKANRAALQLKKHSPEILVGAGIVSIVAGGVLACKSTLKVNEVVDKAKEDIAKIHEATEKGYTEAELEYTVEDSKKDLTIVYAQTGVKFVKLYGPAIALTAAGITCILKSHGILRERNVALAAAYAAVEAGFKDYRERVVERFGKDLDRELKYGIKAKEVERVIVNEDGSETTVKETVDVVDPNMRSPYAKFFDDGCNGWTKNAEYNLKFLMDQQAWANDKLKHQGHLFLNEVYDSLGIPRTQAGNVVGWVYDEENPIGDNFVDFGIFDLYNEKARDFVNGYERTILLDFNVDGNILELLH